jgi:hypothetical protein
LHDVAYFAELGGLEGFVLRGRDGPDRRRVVHVCRGKASKDNVGDAIVGDGVAVGGGDSVGLVE